MTRTIPIQKGQGLGQWVLVAPQRTVSIGTRPPPPPPPPVQHIVYPKERPLPEDKAADKNYWKSYKPTIPDRFGLGIVFRPHGEGRLTVDQLVEDGPARQSLQDIRQKDLLHEIDRRVVFGQPTKVILGILEGKKIAGMAEVYHVQIAPHLYCGPVVGAANIALATSSPNFLILEGIEDWRGFHADILKKPIQWQDGYVIPPKDPGLGVELNEEYIAKFPYTDTALHLEMTGYPVV